MNDEQQAWRRRGVGASDVAAVCGLPEAFGTAFDVWAVKTGRSPGVEQAEAHALTAARAWRDGRIPNTSSATLDVTVALERALAALDDEP